MGRGAGFIKRQMTKPSQLSFWQMINLCIAFALFGLFMYAGGFYAGTGTFPNLFLKSEDAILPPKVMADTTFEELNIALVEDKVSNEVYREGFNCVDYAWNAMRALQWEGIESTIVRLTFTDGTKHAILLAPTGDKGWVFIDPQTDITTAKPVVGGHYFDKKVVAIDILVMGWLDIEEWYKNPEFRILGGGGR